MSAVIFIGPTLRPEEVTAALPNAICLPPVAQGDVYRAALSHPQAIGIVDGYFSGAPSVWHKEILWALSQGVHVFGSASMGALRAAELHAYGMRGVGRIFEAFLSGELEDDDEVAVVHGPPETGFIAASEPMVNIRATLDRAEAAHAISHATRDVLERTAKALFFPHRTWAEIFKSTSSETHGDAVDTELSQFRERLRELAVDRKREDALEMLAAMRNAEETATPFRADFRFEPTHFWNDLVARAANEPTAQSASELDERIVDELRLQDFDAYRRTRTSALLQVLLDKESQRGDLTVAADAKQAAATETRAALGLYSRSQLQTWMSENDLDQKSFDRLVEQEARLQVFAQGTGRAASRHLLNELRLSGRYRALSERARDKADKLGELAASPRARDVVAPNTVQVRIWFFEGRLGQAVPEDVDAFAQSLGFNGAVEFDRALLNEWMYSNIASRRRSGGEDDPPS